MPFQSKKIVIFLYLCFGSSYTVAENLSDIYQHVLKKDPVLNEQQAIYNVNFEQEKISHAQLLPELILSGEYNESAFEQQGSRILGNNSSVSSLGNIDNNITAYRLSLTQPLFDMPRWFLFKQSVSLNAQAKANFAAEQQDFMLRLANAYFDVLRAQKELETLQAEENAVKRQLQQIQQRYDVGLAPLTDVQEARAIFDNAIVNTLETNITLNISFDALEVITGQSYSQLAGLMPDFTTEMPSPLNREAWITFALDNNYRLEAANLGLEAAIQLVNSKKAQHLPKLSGNITYLDTNQQGIEFGSEFTNQQDGTVASIKLTLPLFTGGRISAERRRSYQQYIQAKEKSIFIQRNTIQEARSHYLHVITNIARVKARQQNIISAKSGLNATEAGYKLGTRNIVDVINAQQKWFQAKRDLANARFDYILSSLALKQIAGRLNPNDINQLSRYLDDTLIVKRSYLKTTEY